MIEYLVQTDSSILYRGFDKEKAFKTFDNYETDIENKYAEYNRLTNSYYEHVMLSESIVDFKYIGEEPQEEYPIEVYYDDEDLYEVESETDFDMIRSKESETQESIRSKERSERQIEIIDLLNSFLKELSDEYKLAGFLNRTKYYLYNGVLIRLADHFFNISRVDISEDAYWNDFETRDIKGFLSINVSIEDSRNETYFRGKLKDYDTKKIDYIDIDVDDFDMEFIESEILDKINDLNNV